MENGSLHVWVRSCENYSGRGLESDKMLCLFIDVGYLESIYLSNYLCVNRRAISGVSAAESLIPEYGDGEQVRGQSGSPGHRPGLSKAKVDIYLFIYLSVFIYLSNPLGFISLVLDGINCAKLPASPEMAHQVSHLSLSLGSN